MLASGLSLARAHLRHLLASMTAPTTVQQVEVLALLRAQPRLQLRQPRVMEVAEPRVAHLEEPQLEHIFAPLEVWLEHGRAQG
eukprot:CAMPEP_0170177416 /NCGR_PEP_ID=MMETSP0040_2-20121228/10070_1 /TAXON_ID=641309 /ORGANISM="Lotharella oceanica, Strain CCMP622" /LENGTH=82 /DNA_ID=CAMNT_0010420047 /DNA_START=139 /DNA_END=388 /DNA_ORIENTATION=-